MQSLKQAYEERVKAHITEAASAGAECSSNQAELSREKEEHLAVMRLDDFVVLAGDVMPTYKHSRESSASVPTK